MTVSAPSHVAVGQVSGGAERAPRSSAWGWVVTTLKYVVLITLAASFLLPFYWMASSALKDDSQIYTVPPVWIPIPAHWENYWNAWQTYDFNLYITNTLLKYALPVTLATVVSCSIVAYGFARIRWRGRDLLFSLCMATMMIPFQVTMVPLFITFKKLGWINTYLPLVVPYSFGDAYFIFMLRQFFKQIPRELSDAARMDGANEFNIMVRIIIPLAKPALTVVALFQFMWAWNDYLGPLIYLNREDLYTIALGVENLRRTIGTRGLDYLAYPYLMAVSTVITLPIVIIFFLAQRTFIEGISLTGLKG